ncbi:hypothetical protein [Pseudoalteromonas sp. MTN2-4]|uniref:hypothetical protein n=1 Tax=Pseudoalteromonas sp. MTN2-4 TaxID=3056555 RepID=UPI0036F3FF88
MKLFNAVILFLVSFFASANCDFEVKMKHYDPKLAEQHALEEFKQNRVHFFAVANGFGPSRPGFEKIQISKCLVLDTHWKVLWVGADSEFCNNHKALELQALDYSTKFNKKMLSLASDSKSYQCGKELQEVVP